MSHQDYIAKLDEDQLVRLVELSEDKLKAIRAGGWVELWVVGTDSANYFWFDDFAKAAVCLVAQVTEAASKGRPVEQRLDRQRFRQEEAAQLLEDTEKQLARAKNASPVQRVYTPTQVQAVCRLAGIAEGQQTLVLLELDKQMPKFSGVVDPAIVALRGQNESLRMKLTDARERLNRKASENEQEMLAAMDLECPIPDNPHASVVLRATEARASFRRGWTAAHQSGKRAIEAEA